MRRYFLHQEFRFEKTEESSPERNNFDILIYFDEYKVLETEFREEEFPVAPIFVMVELLKKDIKYLPEDEVFVFSDTLSQETFEAFLQKINTKETIDERENLLTSNDSFYYNSSEEYVLGVETIGEVITFLPKDECIDKDVLARMNRLLSVYQKEEDPATPLPDILLFTGERGEYSDFLLEN